MYVIGTHAQNRDFGMKHVCPGHVFAHAGERCAEQRKRHHGGHGRALHGVVLVRKTPPWARSGSTSTELDKFAQHASARDAAGMPYVAEQVCATFSAKVVTELDLGTHVLFIGEVDEAHKVEGAAAAMTYAFYHQVKGGKTPPKASSYLGEEAPAPAAAASGAGAAPKVAWRCTICGHMEYVDELPDDFVCPICGVGKEFFERVEL